MSAGTHLPARPDHVSRRTVLKASAAAIGAVAAPAIVSPRVLASSGEVNILMWSDYLPASFVDSFTGKTGIKINFTGIGSNEEILNKLKATKGQGFDIASPTLDRAPLWAELDLLQPFDMTKVPIDKVNAWHGRDRRRSMGLWRQGLDLDSPYLGNREHGLAHRPLATERRVPELWRCLGRCQRRQNDGPSPLDDALRGPLSRADRPDGAGLDVGRLQERGEDAAGLGESSPSGASAGRKTSRSCGTMPTPRRTD